MSLSTAEAACVYSALILQDEGLEITADKISALIAAADLEVESIWPTIFARALAGKDLGAFLFNVGAGGVAAAPAGGAAPAAAAGGAAPAAAESKKEEAKEEAKEESDDDMGFGLFD